MSREKNQKNTVELCSIESLNKKINLLETKINKEYKSRSYFTIVCGYLAEFTLRSIIQSDVFSSFDKNIKDLHDATFANAKDNNPEISKSNLEKYCTTLDFYIDECNNYKTLKDHSLRNSSRLTTKQKGEIGFQSFTHHMYLSKASECIKIISNELGALGYSK